MIIAAWQSILDAPFFLLSRTRSPRFPALCLQIIRSVISWHAHCRAERVLFYRDKYRSGFFRLRCVYAGQSVRNYTCRSNRAIEIEIERKEGTILLFFCHRYDSGM